MNGDNFRIYQNHIKVKLIKIRAADLCGGDVRVGEIMKKADSLGLINVPPATILPISLKYLDDRSDERVEVMIMPINISNSYLNTFSLDKVARQPVLSYCKYNIINRDLTFFEDTYLIFRLRNS